MAPDRWKIWHNYRPRHDTEVNRGAGDEGRRESFQLHAIILRCGWVEIDCLILKMKKKT